jgi:hypothetical protein
MENQTRFDLNAAIENWRNELAAQPNLASDDRRELETHLRDAIAGFQQRGLNEEESFWLARRRIGQPQQIGEEFVKADPARVWRERAFWIVLAFLVGSLWEPNSLIFYFFTFHKTKYFDNDYLRLLFYWLPILVGVLILAKGRAGFIYPRISVFFRSRLYVALTALLGVLTNCAVLIFCYWPRHAHDPGSQMNWAVWWSDFWSALFDRTFLPFLLITLLVWLVPVQNRKAPKHA